MLMELLDLPAPLFAALDNAVAPVLPAVARLALWALMASVLTMEIYRLTSPQERIAALKLKFNFAKAQLDAFDGDFEDAWPLMRRMLGAAFGRVAIVLPGTLVAALPLLLLIVWIDTAYAHADVLGFGPLWLRGWETSFIVFMTILALGYKHIRRIQ
ncbi:MAG: hypothetical protein EP335_05200 [Alphaproteobacteria bacterium]|nr:MAG: hypothetical protein EP335_05200 [Alphaproteobacteria bacterium]